MPYVKIKALDQFSHGRVTARPGGVYTVPQVDADDLAKAGLVEIMGTAGDDEVDDLVGGKMEPMTANKMEANPRTKAEKK